MKSASLPGHAGDNDSFQPLEEPGGAALPSRRSAQHRGQQPLRPGPAAPPGRAARSGGAGSSLARPGRVCGAPAPSRPCRRMPRANPSEAGPAARPAAPQGGAAPQGQALLTALAEPAWPRPLRARAHHELLVLAPAAARGKRRTLRLLASLPRSSTAWLYGTPGNAR